MIFRNKLVMVMGRIEEGAEGLGIPMRRSTNQHFGKKERSKKKLMDKRRRVRHSGSSDRQRFRRARVHPSTPGDAEASRV
jgi:hypothetical protein